MRKDFEERGERLGEGPEERQTVEFVDGPPRGFIILGRQRGVVVQSLIDQCAAGVVAPQTGLHRNLMDAGQAPTRGDGTDLLVELAQGGLDGVLVLVDRTSGHRPLAVAAVHPMCATREQESIRVALAMAQEHPRGTESTPDDTTAVECHPAVSGARALLDRHASILSQVTAPRRMWLTALVSSQWPPVDLKRSQDSRISCSASSRPVHVAPSTDLPGSRSL